MAQEARTSWRIRLGGALLLAALAAAAYSSSLPGSFIWDDPDYVVNNPTLRTARGLWLIWAAPAATPQYYPLVHTTFWVEYHLWGLWPMGYKLVNLALHLASALLLWSILRKLAVPGAFVAAGIWALHPINVESVAWITERKNVLSGLFYLLSLAAYLRFDEIRDLKSQIPNRKSEISNPKSAHRWYGLALALFLCALLSKSVTATLPVVIGLILWWKQGRISWRMILPLVPMVLIGAGMGLRTAFLEREQVGAVGWEFDWSAAQRVMIAGWASLFYLWKIAWPAKLSFIYPRWQIDQWGPAYWAAPALVAAALLVLWLLRRRIGRGPLVAFACFLVTLFPALGFLNVYPMRYSFVADHFQYLACIAPIALIVVCVAALLKSRFAQFLVPALVVAGLCMATWLQGLIYQSRRALFTDTMWKNPQSWMVRTNLGHAVRDEALEKRTNGKVKEATALEREGNRCYEEALELAPNLPEPWWSVGIVRLQQERIAEAKAMFERAIVLEPRFAQAYFALGNMAKTEGRLEYAAMMYETAIGLKSGYVEALFNLGVVRERLGSIDGAMFAYLETIRFQPTHIKAHYNLANCYRLILQPADALAHYQQCVRLDPGHVEAWMNMAAVYIQIGDNATAIRCYQRILHIRPDYAPAQQALQRLAP